jgi:hypothetical protein
VAAEAPVAVAPVSPAQQAEEVAAAPPPEQKKRGFWSRIFGRRDQAPEKKDPPANRPPR